MKILEFYRTRTYFIRLLLSITLIVSAFLALFCSVLYFFAKNNAMKLQQEATRKVLRQVNYNVDNLYKTVANLTVSTFADRDIAALMNSRDTDIFQQYNRLSKLDYILNSNLYVHSLYLYNPNNRCYYITPRSQMVACEAPAADNLLASFLREHTGAENIKLLPNRFDAGGQTRYVLTMLKQENGSVLMVNVKPEWLFDNISAINELTDRMLGNIMIYDAEHSFISSDGTVAAADGGTGGEIAARIRADGAPSGDFMIGSGKDKQIVLYATSPLTGWKLVSVQSYGAVFGSIDKIGTFSLFMFACFLLLAIVVSIVISIKLYQPIGSLMRSIRLAPGSRDMAADNKDELGYISLYNERMLEKLSHLQADKQASDSIARNYWLRRLLLEGESTVPDDMAARVREYGLRLDPEGSFIVCILMMTGVLPDRKASETSLLKFAMANVAGEMLGALAPNEAVNAGDHHIAVLLSVERSAASRVYGELPNVLGNVQETLYNYYKITVCASLSPVAERQQDIVQAYGQALLQTEYRIILGKSAVITPERIAANERNAELALDERTEKRWLETVRSGDLKKIEAELAHIFQRLSAFRHDHLLHAMQYLTVATTNELREQAQGAGQSVKPALLSFNRRVLERDTLDEMFVLFMDLFQEIAERRKAARENKHQLLAEAVKEAIDAHYADPNLSLQSLASMLRMSAAHVGKMFKLSESVSVADYINEVRIGRATAMLQTSDATITQIMYEVGFVSESHFYRLFKKSIGLTPREFRTRQTLGERP